MHWPERVGCSYARASLLFAPVAMLLAGCPSGGNATSADPPATCAKAGNACTFAPGKLGLCVESAGGNPAFICQSQH
jgi:hypothetical protein